MYEFSYLYKLDIFSFYTIQVTIIETIRDLEIRAQPVKHLLTQERVAETSIFFISLTSWLA